MTQPDWSKAPEGATHSGNDARLAKWYRVNGDTVECWVNQGSWAKSSFRMEDVIAWLIPRPTSNTEGLPEVGDECLVSIMGDEFRAKITYVGDGVFCYQDLNHDMEYSGATKHTVFRPIHRTITIGDIEVPEPVREPLEDRQEYWVVDLGEDDLVVDYSWCEDRIDKEWLKRGLIHLTKEAAITHAKALIKASGGEVE